MNADALCVDLESRCNPDHPVLTPADPEGNGIGPVTNVELVVGDKDCRMQQYGDRAIVVLYRDPSAETLEQCLKVQRLLHLLREMPPSAHVMSSVSLTAKECPGNMYTDYVVSGVHRGRTCIGEWEWFCEDTAADAGMNEEEFESSTVPCVELYLAWWNTHRDWSMR